MQASKVIAEQEAWKIAKEPETKFSLTTICPPMIFGSPQQPIDSMEAINTSAGAVWGIVDAEKVPETSFPVFTDVQDIAKIHVLASTEEVAKGQRYLAIAGKCPFALQFCSFEPRLTFFFSLFQLGHFDNSQIASFGRQAFPDQASRFPAADAKAAPPHFSTDSSKVEKELGIEFMPFRTSVRGTLEELFKIEKSIKEKKN